MFNSNCYSAETYIMRCECVCEGVCVCCELVTLWRCISTVYMGMCYVYVCVQLILLPSYCLLLLYVWLNQAECNTHSLTHSLPHSLPHLTPSLTPSLSRSSLLCTTFRATAFSVSNCSCNCVSFCSVCAVICAVNSFLSVSISVTLLSYANRCWFACNSIPCKFSMSSLTLLS